MNTWGALHEEPIVARIGSNAVGLQRPPVMKPQDSYMSISVDDGHPDDLRMAALLAKLGLPATFYVPVRNPERPLMSREEICHVGKSFEIGAHTYNHRVLRGLNGSTLREEIDGGKRWLEDLLGRKVESFCYPKGKFDKAALEAVANAGFVGSRTCMFNLVGMAQDSQQWGVATHAYSHSRWIQVRHALLEGNYRGLWNYIVVFRLSVDWVVHFKRAVERVLKYGGVAHLYLHSWEITQTDQWKRLEEVLGWCAARVGLRSVTNGDLFRMQQNRGASA